VSVGAICTSRACSSRSQSPSSRICRPLATRLKRPSQVPRWGLPMVTTRCTGVSGSTTRQARATKPPMLWHTSIGGRPVSACARRTASLICGT